jgi:PAS domain S-box-containing protein
MRTRKPRHKLSYGSDLLAGILTSATDAIIAVDDVLRIVVFNSAAERMFVCRAEEAIGCPVGHFIPQGFGAIDIKHLQPFSEDGDTVRSMGSPATVWALRSTGEEFPVEASISKVESGGKKFFTVIIRDITERHRAEEAVRESEQRFCLVADSAPVLMWMSGTDKLCTYFNKTWLDFTGRSVDEELGNGWAQGVHREDLQRCMDTYTQAFNCREEFRIEYRLRQHDGSYRWILDIGVPRFDQDGWFAGYIGVGVDVTDRRVADEVRFRYAAIVESSDDAIAGVDTNGTVTNWNKGAERLFGYTAKEAIGRHISFLSTADRLEDWKDVLKKVLNGEVLRHYDTVRLRKDGTPVEVSLTVSPIIDAENRIVGASGIARDITQRKRAEEAASRHSAIVESSEDAIISKNLDGIITTWNPGAEHLFGYTEAEAVGQPITILIPPELCDEENRILEKLKAGRVAHLETIRVTKAGERVNVSLSISPIKNSSGKITGISKIARDITERKGAELALRETNLALEKQTAVLQSQKKLLKIFVKSVPAGVAMFDREMRYLQASDRWCADYGLDSSQVVGRSHYELFPDLPPRWKEIHHRALQGETLRAEEDRWDRADGGTIWICWVVRPWLTLDGTVGGILIFAEDITRHKLAEQALSDMNRRLLKAQEEERVRIARELHDDVNQRLSLVTIQLDQMKSSSPTADWRSRLEQLAVKTRDISADVHSMAHHLHSSKLDFLGLVPAVQEVCREMSLRHEIDIDVEASDVDESLGQDITICVYRVIQEALQNVVRHSGAHEVRVSINKERNRLITTVSDDGCGFDPDSLVPGKGLGLVTMRERLRLVHGKLRLESAPGAGSRIHIAIPLEASAQ